MQWDQVDQIGSQPVEFCVLTGSCRRDYILSKIDPDWTWRQPLLRSRSFNHYHIIISRGISKLNY